VSVVIKVPLNRARYITSDLVPLNSSSRGQNAIYSMSGDRFSHSSRHHSDDRSKLRVNSNFVRTPWYLGQQGMFCRFGNLAHMSTGLQDRIFKEMIHEYSIFILGNGGSLSFLTSLPQFVSQLHAFFHEHSRFDYSIGEEKECQNQPGLPDSCIIRYTTYQIRG
jgi:hypothetical protein